MNALLNADVSGRLATLVPAGRAALTNLDRRCVHLVRGTHKSGKENVK